MCGRYALAQAGVEIEDELDVHVWDGEPLAAPNYNIAPTTMAPVIPAVAERQLRMMRWGLIPAWAKEPTIGSRMINARAETITEKPSFRNLVREHRCVVIASGYFEWQRTPNGKVPHYIQAGAGGLMLFAGLWTEWTRGPTPLTTFTIITTAPAASLAEIHDRMPAILPRAAAERWLAPDCDREEAVSLLCPAAEPLRAHAVSTAVNSPRENGPHCLAPAPEAGTQPSLFGG
jgi:putative SOS response-associated peptidase YedK